MRALFVLALPECVEKFSLVLFFRFLFVFYEILLEFPIFGIFLFLFFLFIGRLSLKKTNLFGPLSSPFQHRVDGLWANSATLDFDS